MDFHNLPNYRRELVIKAAGKSESLDEIHENFDIHSQCVPFHGGISDVEGCEHQDYGEKPQEFEK